LWKGQAGKGGVKKRFWNSPQVKYNDNSSLGPGVEPEKRKQQEKEERRGGTSFKRIQIYRQGRKRGEKRLRGNTFLFFAKERPRKTQMIQGFSIFERGTTDFGVRPLEKGLEWKKVPMKGGVKEITEVALGRPGGLP